MPLMPSPGIPKTVSTPQARSVSTNMSAAVGEAMMKSAGGKTSPQNFNRQHRCQFPSEAMRQTTRKQEALVDATRNKPKNLWLSAVAQLVSQPHRCRRLNRGGDQPTVRHPWERPLFGHCRNKQPRFAAAAATPRYDRPSAAEFWPN